MRSATPRRMILMVASQCAALDHQLSFLPPADWSPGDEVESRERLAFDLFDQFVDPAAGACVPVPFVDRIREVKVPPSRQSLLVNPTREIATLALNHAFAEAHEHESVLVVYFIGHGVKQRLAAVDAAQHLLLVADSHANPSTSFEAWDPYGSCNELIKTKAVPGFVLLVDACYASSARPQVSRWGTAPSTYVWMGASQDTKAFNACFSTTLLGAMRYGEPASTHELRPPSELLPHRVRKIVDDNCRRPNTGQPQQADDLVSRFEDGYVYVTRNRVASAYEDELGLEGATRDRMRASLSDDYQLFDMTPIAAEVERHTLTTLVGGPGTGKTALLSVLRAPPNHLDVRRLDAIAFLSATSSVETIALDTHPQLIRNPQYADLVRRYEHRTPTAEVESPSERYLASPLSLAAGISFVIGLDGLDQLSPSISDGVLAGIQSILDRCSGSLRVLATSRPRSAGGPIPPNANAVAMPDVKPGQARSYLAAKGITDANVQEQLLALNPSLNWLVLALAAEQIRVSSDGVPRNDRGALYADIRFAAEQALGFEPVNAVVDVLVAAGEVAGAGPRLPIDLLAAAANRLGGPASVIDLNAVLNHPRLYRIVERTNPATSDEHVGLFHPTAIENLRRGDDRMVAVHRAISDVLDEL